ncbi:hypothetical protein [Dysgonomonas termitidis]|uniref:Uncharacterized protein n=1 Tax=Dysgonomonas termitidis TaxID=1516126 RepID=A0ABV9L1X9_9BACT
MNTKSSDINDIILKASDYDTQAENYCYSLTFDKLGNYNDTVVSINIRIPFKRLHLIYLIPYHVIKAYWNAVIRNINLSRLSSFPDMVASEKEELSKVESFMPLDKINAEAEFPDITI